MNKKGFILSTYVYILLVFFLLLLGSTLMVLNNTKLLANKNKQDSLSGISDFNLVLLGDKNITLYGIDTFEDPGYIASTLDGEKLEAKITKETINNEDGSYTNIIYYTVTYSGKTKQIERRVTIQNNLKKYIEYLYNSAASENGLIKDNTVDRNIRYAGSNEMVKNYVSFDGEVWRIIGIVNGKVKLIKNDSIGTYSWDSSTEDKNTGWGYNIWETIDGKTKSDGTTKADLNILLNEGYYDGTYPSVCYGGKNNTEKLCPTEYVNSLLKSMIDENALCHLVGQTYSEPSTPHYGLSTLKSYYNERGTTIYSGITNIAKTEWNGAVGLIYPSDYGYASTDNECITNLRAGVSYENETWNYSNTKCKNNNWLHKNNNYWTISPNLDDSIYVFFVYSNGFVHSYSASNAYEVFPVVYLKSNILIESGTGTSTDPYILILG